MPIRFARPVAAVALAVMLPGCVLLKKGQPDAGSAAPRDLPALWDSAGEGNGGKISTGWVKTFDDRRMERLIDEAMANNHDLAAAASRLRQAEEGTILGRASRFPSLNIGGSSRRTRRTELVTPPAPAATTSSAAGAAAADTGTGTGMAAAAMGDGAATDGGAGAGDGSTGGDGMAATGDGTSSTMTDGAAMAAAGGATAAVATPDPVPVIRYSTDYGLSLDASWEMDLWGRLRDLDHAAYADFEAAQADFRAARLSLAANTAKAYFDLITAQQQLDLAVATRESYERNGRIIERNYKAGDDTASALDVQFSRNNIASAERDVVGREQARDEAARVLEGLLGRYPSAAVRAGTELPKLRKGVPAGLPSELLMRRPDLVSAAGAVRASAKRADAARKDLLPSFRLSAGGSTSSEELGEMLLDPEQIVWNAASSLAQTVYQGGALRAEARRALERNREALQNFAGEALRALREVESALAAERSLAQQEAFLEVELRQADLAEKQASRDYSEGIVGILEVLEAQRRAVQARNSMISLRNQRLQNRVDLHLALGGDFRTEV